MTEDFRKWETLTLIIQHAKIIAENTPFETFSESKISKLKRTIERMKMLANEL